MFDIMEERIKNKKKSQKIENEIKKSVPQIHQALNSSANVSATETRMEMDLNKDELLTFLFQHPEKIQNNRALFNAILEKYRSISGKISKLL